MNPITVGLEVRGVDDVVDEAVIARRLDVVSLSVKSTVLGRRAQQIPRLGIFGKYRNDAARGVAVQRGEGAAQHFDTVGAAQVELRKLPLAIRHGAGNAVGIQAYAAHAETRASTKAAHRQLQILRIILTVLRR